MNISRGGDVIWKLLSPLATGREINAFKKKAWQSKHLKDHKQLNFSAEWPSVMQQSRFSNCRHKALLYDFLKQSLNIIVGYGIYIFFYFIA